MKTISVKIDIGGRIWYKGMRYFSEAEINRPTDKINMTAD